VLYHEGRVQGVELHTGESLYSDAVIVAVGGMSVPHTGSTGDGYAWAKEAGHTITELFPTEVPLTSDEPMIRSRQLQGLSLRGVALTVRDPKGKKLVTHRGDMLFTHFGLSGPTALRCSQFVVKTLKKFQVPAVNIEIDLLPDQKIPELEEIIREKIEEHPRRTVKNTLKELLPERLIPFLLQQAGVEEELKGANLSHTKLTELCRTIKGFVVKVNGTLPIEKAFVTGGGVHVKEIEPRTMQSKLMKGLYFCGEILDVHGYTGGYNITAALCTGYVAGKSAAEQVKEKGGAGNATTA
jgi:predicted Rossmann fold flavoprotein